MESEPGPDLAAIANQVERILVDSFGFPAAEARQRLALWRAEQHRLTGETLAGLLPQMNPEEAAQAALRHVLAGNDLADQLRHGAADLGLPPPD